MAMMLNMVVVSAVSVGDFDAENPFTPVFKVNPETTAPGNSVVVELYVPAGVYDVIYFTVSPGTDVSLDDITVAKANFSSEVSDFSRSVSKNKSANNIFIEVDAFSDGGATITTLPLITFTVNVGNAEVGNKTLLEFKKLADMDVTIGGQGLSADQKALSSATVDVTSIVKNEITDDGKWELEWTKPSQEAVAIIAYYDGTTMLSAELIAIADMIDETTGMCSFISNELKYEGATMVRCYLFDKLNGLHHITNVIEEIYL
ncbi:MAG: hypothetical protein IJA16_01280 [Clostridia bacterium]|nr:hypothetical protein [Clostridia bacterium]